MNATDGTETGKDLREELNLSLINSGMTALRDGDEGAALTLFERAHTMSESPIAGSLLGYCTARTGGDIEKALSLCKEALRRDPHNPVHYLNLGRVYLLSGNKEDAVKVLHDGLGHEENSDIRAELAALGNRKEPLLSFFGRSNPINKYFGIVLKKLGFQ
ncbi:MAG: tetratricopeptide repeat protein [Nitrospiraceae bacterium]|nr:tetratricopeptide repeat protein [Nitrospiraceae bacterium]